MVSLQFYNYLLIIGLLYFSSAASLTEGDAHTPCNGSIAECDEEGEMLMESDISRRVLAQKKYISPGALKPDQPVCNGGGRGQAYSKSGNCLPQSSNPPDRGCEKYYRCRSDN
ncbi:Rapid ALkalinization Factor [Parasponia andersonii]|uniref:Rapid ALkalinization Factor n=1 Tax=Parasponia andersonii TaxID=3476 RepID=A0A2P5C3N8_PARAD|nr:Rapid ALkalinization Factor [Parasponia andersonii]